MEIRRGHDPVGPCPADPGELAASIRSVASRAHRLLRGPAPADPGELSALRAEVDCLRASLDGRALDPEGGLRRWVEALRRRLGDG